MTTKITHTLQYNSEQLKAELEILDNSFSKTKDILIVVHDQVEYLKKCINSIKKNTKNDFKLWIWDNASSEETKAYLRDLDANVIGSEENIGFIIPNNELAKLGNNEYVILLNSDTEVHDGWDRLMTGWLDKNQDTGVVGYLGGWLDHATGRGHKFGFGHEVDYVCGWAMCLPRSLYNRFGLFDQQNLSFAYCEDSDFSLRLKEQNLKVYAFYLDLVSHFENKTASTLIQAGYDFTKSFENNHSYIRQRWLGQTT